MRGGRKGDSMGFPPPVIRKVSAQDYMKLVIETSDGRRYFSDLSSMSTVYCFPKSSDEWKSVTIDNYGLALNWSNRFEVHVDQVIGFAYKVEQVLQSKSAHRGIV